MSKLAWCAGTVMIAAAIVSGNGIIHAQVATAVTSPYPLVEPFPGFDRVPSGERLQPRFDVAGGQSTKARYTGYVEVFVSGTGLDNRSQPDIRSDAFYNFRSSTNASLGLFDNTLRVGSETPLQSLPRQFPWTPNSSLHLEGGSIHVAGLAVLYEERAYAASGALPLDVQHGLAPEYSATHSYHLLMDLSCYLGRLTFGFGDGGTFDNSSDTYDISIWQVIPSAR